MNAKPEPISFPKLIQDMRDSICSDWPTVVGGVWSDGAEMKKQLGAFKSKSALGWRVWEMTDSCTIGHDWFEEQDQDGKDNWRWLERARLFGEGGDLDIRRDGERFLWRYVGEPDHAPPCGNKLEPDDGSPVYCREQTALLWGTRERDQEQWFDDRVSGAKLTYAVDGDPERVQVRYREYTQAGQALTVWLQGLEAYEEVDNG